MNFNKEVCELLRFHTHTCLYFVFSSPTLIMVCILFGIFCIHFVVTSFVPSLVSQISIVFVFKSSNKSIAKHQLRHGVAIGRMQFFHLVLIQ